MTDERYFYGTGRRKCAVARVRLHPGAGDHIVNEKPLEEVFTRILHRHVMERPFEATENAGRYHLEVRVAGGGISSWADAIAHGISRALIAADEGNQRPLRKGGHLTRDARVKERKKYGLKRARKAPQYTKR